VVLVAALLQVFHKTVLLVVLVHLTKVMLVALEITTKRVAAVVALARLELQVLLYQLLTAVSVLFPHSI
jgi:hypothetical protein